MMVLNMISYDFMEIIECKVQSGPVLFNPDVLKCAKNVLNNFSSI